MKSNRRQPLQWLATFAFTAALAACGGGGGSSSTTASTPPPPPDARNGDYVMFAADARKYTLSLDFNAKTYHVVGNGTDVSGTIKEETTAGVFDFDGSSTSAAPAGAPHFKWANDTAVGAFSFAAGTVPFIAPRTFATTVADAAGTYNFLTSQQDTAAPSDNAIFSGDLSASGTLRMCNDNQVYAIAQCPTTSVVTATVTYSSDHFIADLGGGATFPFYVAKVGSDKALLRASASSGTSRRLYVGMESAAFAGGTFTGENSLGKGTTTSLTSTAYSATWRAGSTSTTHTGTVNALGGTGPVGLLGITTSADGNFFAMRNSSIMVLIAARGSTAYPGYIEFDQP
jgi:hypothetical protein